MGGFAQALGGAGYNQPPPTPSNRFDPSGAMRTFFPITNFFASPGDPSSYTSTHGGQAPAPGQLAYEGINPKQDSLTQYLRSLSNFTGSAGQTAFGAGGQGVGQAMDFWGNILSGNRGAMAQALSPEIQSATSGFEQQRRAMDQFAPMGGGRAAQGAALPYREAGQISNLIATLRPQAAQQQGQLGLNEQQIGLGALQQALQALLARRGQNFQVDTANRQMLTSGLESLMGDISRGFGGAARQGGP